MTATPDTRMLDTTEGQRLAQQDAEQLNSPQGKAKLRKALKDSINNVLHQREGFGGIDDVYFTSFIIQ